MKVSWEILTSKSNFFKTESFLKVQKVSIEFHTKIFEAFNRKENVEKKIQMYNTVFHQNGNILLKETVHDSWNLKIGFYNVKYAEICRRGKSYRVVTK